MFLGAFTKTLQSVWLSWIYGGKAAHLKRKIEGFGGPNYLVFFVIFPPLYPGEPSVSCFLCDSRLN